MPGRPKSDWQYEKLRHKNKAIGQCWYCKGWVKFGTDWTHNSRDIETRLVCEECNKGARKA